MAKLNLTGNNFGLLTVTEKVELSKNESYWRCMCRCGTVVVARGGHLKSGSIKSCGCLRGEKHGKSKTPTYRSYVKMKERCYDRKNNRYKDYGGRGIKVCDRWIRSFFSFLKDMGLRPSPSYSLGRKDNDGDYVPNNCRWETCSEQANNRRSSRIISCNGKTMTLAQWCKELKLKYGTVLARIDRYGWSHEKALELV